MANIEIRDFTTVQGVNDGDYVVLSLSGGTSAKMAVGLLISSATTSVVPSIKDSMWWIGNVNTGVVAEGKTPQFRKSNLGIEYKYEPEADTAWRLLVPMSDIKFSFEELSEEQREQISLKYSDLTEEEIGELQRPAVEGGEYAMTQGDYAKEQGIYAKSQGDYAKEQAEIANTQSGHAKEQGDYAKEQGDYAKEQGDYAAEINELILLGTITSNPSSILD